MGLCVMLRLSVWPCTHREYIFLAERGTQPIHAAIKLAYFEAFTQIIIPGSFYLAFPKLSPAIYFTWPETQTSGNHDLKIYKN